MYSVREEKRLLNFALKYREQINRDDFNIIVNLCYGRIMEKKLNSSIEKTIIPAYNRIIKTALNNNYVRK